MTLRPIPGYPDLLVGDGGTVWRRRTDGSWRPLTDPVASREGEANPNAKLNWQNVRAIRAAAARKVPLGQLAKEYGVTYFAIKAVVRRMTWKNDPADDGR